MSRRRRRIVALVAAIVLYGAAAFVIARDAGAVPATPGCVFDALVGGRLYTGHVGRSSRTSCPFARAVGRASLRVIVDAGGAGDGDFYTRAYSPVTHRSYRVHCFANGDLDDPAYGMRVDCRAGIGARVVYRAWRS
jgi:hypothetical protein